MLGRWIGGHWESAEADETADSSTGKIRTRLEKKGMVRMVVEGFATSQRRRQHLYGRAFTYSDLLQPCKHRQVGNCNLNDILQKVHLGERSDDIETTVKLIVR